MKSLGKRIVSCALAAVLAAGLVPAAALGAGQPQASVGPAQQVAVEDGSADAATGVFVDVIDDFAIIEQTPSFSVTGTQAALDLTEGRLFATVTGGSGVVSATWTVTDAAGNAVGTFDAVPDAGGKWTLPLSKDGAAGTLNISAPCEYTCAFQATDKSNSQVSCTVAVQVLREGEVSDYGPKTIYEDHEETFDGPATFAEPSATGLIHKFAQHLSAAEALAGSAVFEALDRLAADHAAAQGQSGVYGIFTAWSLEALLTHPVAGDPAPYKGALSVVIPVPAAGPAAGSTVTVFGYGPDGAFEPFTATVAQDTASGQRYVRFETDALGAFALATFDKAAGASVRVTATAQGSGFINYEGAYTWPKDATKRYVLSPAAGWRLAAVEAIAGAAAISVPESVLTLGYFDLDLAALPAGTTEVFLTAAFERIAQGPDVPKHGLRVEVAGGTGAAYVNGQVATTQRFEFTAADEVQLAFVPETPSVSVERATITMGGAELPLNVVGGRAVVRNLAADALVRVWFSSADPQPVLPFQVSAAVVGGHGSIDAPFGAGTTADHAARTVAEGDSVTFALHPEPGYAVYTVTEGAADLSGSLARQSGSVVLTLADVHRDHAIQITFRKAEDKPPVVPDDEYVTIEAASEVAPGAACAPATVTPPAAIIPKGGSYSFAIIPPSGQAALAQVLAKGAGELAWRDITGDAVWVEWPEQPAGTTATGYYELPMRGVGEDTFVRIIFRDATASDPLRPPTPTRTIKINVTGEGGTVSPNTVGKPPLVVPVGKPVQVTIIRADGAYVSSVVTAKDTRRAQPGDTVELGGGAKDTTGAANVHEDDVLGGSDTFEIPDGTEDEEYTFDFSFGAKPGPGPSSSGSSSAGSSSGSSSAGSSSGSSSGGSGGGAQGAAFVVTPVVVPGADGKVHGSISPAAPVTVPRGDSYRFTFTPHAGYKVASVTTDDGRTLARGHVASALLSDVQRHTELRVAFAPRTEEDALGTADRVVHRLQSLARTGDLTPPAIAALLALASAAAGIAFLATGKRRRKEEAAE